VAALSARLVVLDRLRATASYPLRLLNDMRRLDPRLCIVARARSRDMIAQHYFSHHIPGTGTVFTILDRLGVAYGPAGENLAPNNYALYVRPDAVLRWTERDWLHSPEHQRNMLDPSFTRVGIGLASSLLTGRVVITEIFAGP
jgi:uncharacterized protein YkwD